MKKSMVLSLVLGVFIMFTGLSALAEVVNLNKANAAALQQHLKGIGPVKADAIVAYRKKNGNFKSLDDLQNVKGIGPELIKKNKSNLSLSKGVSAAEVKKKVSKKATDTKKSADKVKKKTAETKKAASEKKSSSKQKADSAKSTAAKEKEKVKKKQEEVKKSGS